MHQAGTGIGSHMVAVEHGNITLEERMIHVQVFQLVAGGFGKNNNAV